MASKTWTSTKGLSIRRDTDGTTPQGTGGAKRIYVGRSAGKDYDFLIEFTLDWADVGQIISAQLNLYTDDFSGRFPQPSTSDTPKIVVRRIGAGSAWSEGNNADEDYDSSDYENPSFSTTGQRVSYPSKAANTLTVIDITDIVEAWAPTAVKKRSGAAGSNLTNRGLRIDGYTNVDFRWSGWSEDATGPGATLKPTITLNYTLGVTTPNAPTNLAPSGAVASLASFQGDFTDQDPNDKLASSEVEVYDSTATNSGQTITAGTRVWQRTQTATPTEATNGRFTLTPNTFVPARNTTYKWRSRVTDNEGRVSLWTNLVSFSVTNTAPTAPVADPASGSSYDSLNGLFFRGGTFSDPDGDSLLAYQIQLSPYPSGDPRWDDDNFILWNTGKVYVASGATSWQSLYGGSSLVAGTYYWRSRHWDRHDAPSNWTYASITLTADFNIQPGSQSSIQLEARAPWRIVIKEMEYKTGAGSITGESDTDVFVLTSHGFVAGQTIRFTSLTGGAGLFTGTTYTVAYIDPNTFQLSGPTGSFVNITTDLTASVYTKVTTRGPGNIVAVLENAKSVGASIMYNSPGELHFTLPVDHPQIGVIEPRQTHYSLQFYGGDGWKEVYAGLIVDYDANEENVIFYGLDYLGLFDSVMDERYDPAYPDLPPPTGSKYVNQTLSGVITSVLTHAIGKTNSPVGFITLGTVASMSERVTIWSTMEPTLSFISGLIDSHRQGQGINTRISVRQKTSGGYEVVVENDPGITRDNLRLKYGELVQGYRVIPFGTDWANRVAGIGRGREGLRVMYRSELATSIATSIWGDFAIARLFDGVNDEADFRRRLKQAAIHAGKLGKQLGLGLRIGLLQPRDGYDITDEVPVAINHGVVDTDSFGSGYWVIYGVTWEAADTGESNVTLTLLPREDTTAPDTNLVHSAPISPQAEWQIGWEPPDPLQASSPYWLDQNTRIVYRRVNGTLVAVGITGDI